MCKLIILFMMKLFILSNFGTTNLLENNNYSWRSNIIGDI